MLTGRVPPEETLPTAFRPAGVRCIPEMEPSPSLATKSHRRSGLSARVPWEPTDTIITDFFWLSVAEPAKGQSVDATVRDNAVTITTAKVKQFELGLDSRLIAYDQPLKVSLNGKTEMRTVRPSLLTLCQSMAQRGDPSLAFTCRVRLTAD